MVYVVKVVVDSGETTRSVYMENTDLEKGLNKLNIKIYRLANKECVFYSMSECLAARAQH